MIASLWKCSLFLKCVDYFNILGYNKYKEVIFNGTKNRIKSA